MVITRSHTHAFTRSLEALAEQPNSRPLLRSAKAASNGKRSELITRLVDRFCRQPSCAQTEPNTLEGLKVLLASTGQQDLLNSLPKSFIETIEPPNVFSLIFRNISDPASRQALLSAQSGLNKRFYAEAYAINRYQHGLKEYIGVLGEDYTAFVARLGPAGCAALRHLDLTGLNSNAQAAILERCAQDFPHITSLKIKSHEITQIPATLLATVKYLDCGECNRLTEIHAPRALEVRCNKCHDLKSLIAPRATQIRATFCLTLEQLSAPVVKKIACSWCLQLQMLDVPLAQHVICRGCSRLHSLHADNATYIECWSSDDLHNLRCSSVVNLNASHCPQLPSIEAPHALEISCYGCRTLRSINASRLTYLSHHDCPALETLNVPADTVGL